MLHSGFVLDVMRMLRNCGQVCALGIVFVCVFALLAAGSFWGKLLCKRRCGDFPAPLLLVLFEEHVEHFSDSGDTQDF